MLSAFVQYGSTNGILLFNFETKYISKRVKVQVINYQHPISMSSKPHVWGSQLEKLRYTKFPPLQKVAMDSDDWVNFNGLFVFLKTLWMEFSQLGERFYA